MWQIISETREISVNEKLTIIEPRVDQRDTSLLELLYIIVYTYTCRRRTLYMEEQISSKIVWFFQQPRPSAAAAVVDSFARA